MLLGRARNCRRWGLLRHQAHTGYPPGRFLFDGPGVAVSPDGPSVIPGSGLMGEYEVSDRPPELCLAARSSAAVPRTAARSTEPLASPPALLSCGLAERVIVVASLRPVEWVAKGDVSFLSPPWDVAMVPASEVEASSSLDGLPILRARLRALAPRAGVW